MKHHILLPIDFSPVSDSQIEYALRLVTEPASTRLTLLYAVSPNPEPIPVAPYESIPVVHGEPPDPDDFLPLLEELANPICEAVPDLEVDIVSTLGHPLSVMAGALSKEGEEIVHELVIGSHGHGAVFDLIFGSVTAAVLKAARCPVHVIPTWQKNLAFLGHHGVFAAIDFSDVSGDVLAAAMDHCRRTSQDLTVVHADLPSIPFVITGYGDITPTPAQRIGRIGLELEKLIDAHHRPDDSFTVTPLVLSGDPVRSIHDEIEARSPSLLVLGAHRHGAFHDLVLGSVSRNLLKKLAVPALIVPADKPE